MEEPNKIHLCLNCNLPIVKDKRSKKIRSTRFHNGCMFSFICRSPVIYCECGCGELLHSVDINGVAHRFKSGHFLIASNQFNGTRNPKFNGYKCQSQNGYILVRVDHRFADNRGYVPEHRYVWEQEYFACLLSWTIVHHRDHDRQNNVWYNLWAMTKSEHDRLESYYRTRNNKGQFV